MNDIKEIERKNKHDTIFMSVGLVIALTGILTGVVVLEYGYSRLLAVVFAFVHIGIGAGFMIFSLRDNEKSQNNQKVS